MASRKLITVFGATGAQGGSVARALLGKPDFAVRAATRDVKRPSSLALCDLGATVVQGDLDSEKSVEEVMGGAHGVFLVTNFYEGFSKEKEIRQLLRAKDAHGKDGGGEKKMSRRENIESCSIELNWQGVAVNGLKRPEIASALHSFSTPCSHVKL
ncbi:nmrA-like family domain-containing protein 1 [Pleurodeles waltl]|uniref:nmrA-like family domain-containing protein 1 n=1 Tax=Pleurodeles waltl TaxID=8319 RepID=UPI0037098309